MVIMTAKVPKRRLLLIVLLLIAAAVVLALCLHGAGSETEKPTKSSAQGATNEARIAFLEGYGWQVEPEPVKTQQVIVPADPSEVFLRYNELQISQGYDLLQYSGEELTRYVYRITNYPDEAGVYYATLLVKDGQIVGADVASSAKTGVMHGLKMPEGIYCKVRGAPKFATFASLQTLRASSPCVVQGEPWAHSDSSESLTSTTAALQSPVVRRGGQ